MAELSDESHEILNDSNKECFIAGLEIYSKINIMFNSLKGHKNRNIKHRSCPEIHLFAEDCIRGSFPQHHMLLQNQSISVKTHVKSFK